MPPDDATAVARVDGRVCFHASVRTHAAFFAIRAAQDELVGLLADPTGSAS